jgi:hypothetical protein
MSSPLSNTGAKKAKGNGNNSPSSELLQPPTANEQSHRLLLSTKVQKLLMELIYQYFKKFY